MDEILLIGLDAASKHHKFGYAIGILSNKIVHIESAGCLVKGRPGINDVLPIIAQRLAALPRGSRALIALDAPLGWPKSLAPALNTHLAGEPLTSGKDELFKRETDRNLKKRGHSPLEVGANRIARAAVEALTVIDLLRTESKVDIPLAWTPSFQGQAAIEVYPAATLKAHGVPHTKYKKPNQLEARRTIAARLAVELPELIDYAEGKVDAFDAVLCMLGARDFMLGACEPPEDAITAAREGWIWVRR
jgi:predicted nuclease with RNAse H fold